MLCFANQCQLLILAKFDPSFLFVLYFAHIFLLEFVDGSIARFSSSGNKVDRRWRTSPVLPVFSLLHGSIQTGASEIHWRIWVDRAYKHLTTPFTKVESKQFFQNDIKKRINTGIVTGVYSFVNYSSAYFFFYIILHNFFLFNFKHCMKVYMRTNDGHPWMMSDWHPLRVIYLLALKCRCRLRHDTRRCVVKVRRKVRGERE